MNQNNRELLSLEPEVLLPSVSIDCVILGFSEGEVKILLNRFKSHHQWMIPGGFVFRAEGLDTAAYRILYHRTNLKDCYLRQFYTFGDYNRTNLNENQQILNQNEIENQEESHWFLQRFISVGYFAFVNYDNVKIGTNVDEDIQWFSLDKIPQLYSDHNKIIEKVILSLRTQINYIPIGLDLLPEKFTVSELRIIYETILGRKIDRRNFQRKILSSGLINKLEEVSKKWGVKETTLFSFNKERYIDALENGISLF